MRILRRVRPEYSTVKVHILHGVYPVLHVVCFQSNRSEYQVLIASTYLLRHNRQYIYIRTSA